MMSFKTPLTVVLIPVILFLGLQLQLAHSQGPTNLCGTDGINCYEFEFKGGNNLLVVKGDEFIPNVAPGPGGPEFIKNPGFWEHVNELITLGFEIKSVLYIENEDFNSYRVILTK